MNTKSKYVNYYRHALSRCRLSNLKPDGDLSLVMENSLRPAFCLTRVFDTADAATVFDRLRIEGSFEGAKLEVLVAAAGLPEDAEGDLQDSLFDPSLDYDQTVERLKGMAHVRAVNRSDLLLHSLRGRYVWIFVGIVPGGACSCRLEGMRLDFPRESFDAYFPEVYQDNEFFDRYLSIFQSMFLDLEREVDRLPQMLDYENASDENLMELASWLGVDSLDGIFSPAQIRQIIAQLDLYQGGKGTRRALEAALELACGVRPRIVEQFQFDRLPASEPRRRLNAQLYTDGPNQFCVILDLTPNKALRLGQREIDRLIDAYSVIGSTHKLVLLHDCNHTDAHCYLDVNSRLSTPENASIDEMTLGGYLTIN